MALSSDNIIRIGVISFAHGHINAYLESIKHMDNVRVIAAWDEDRERGLARCQHYGIVYERNLDELLRREDIDAVFVTSPTNQHATHVIAAAQAGKHVLLQKPMALTLADCDKIIAAVKRYGIKFSMCYQMRVDPVNRKIKELLDEGALGKIAIVRRRHAINALLTQSFARPDNWHIDPVQNMGMFMDDASHATDWFYWMLGRPVSVMAEIDNVVTTVAPDDNGIAIYRFAKKEMGVLLNSSTMLAAEATTEIYGDKGVLVQNYGDAPSSWLPHPPEAPALKMYRAGAKEWITFDLPSSLQQWERIQAVPRPLIDYLQGRTGPLVSAEDGRISIEMVLGAYQSAQEGRRIRFVL